MKRTDTDRDQVIEDVATATHNMMLEELQSGRHVPSWFRQAHKLRYCNMPQCQVEEVTDE